MLIGLFSVKGSPGATATALAVAAVWPRPVVLLEADLSGGDLSYRCRAAHGGPVSANRGLLRLAAAVRDGAATPQAVFEQSQLLACGVNLVQGITGSAQARGLAVMWPTLGHACAASEVDVVADLGRLDRASPLLPLAQSAQHLLPVGWASLESVMHLTEGLVDLAAELTTHATLDIRPVLVGPDTYAARDCADLDDVLTRAGLPVTPTRPMPHDAKALQRLERGERPGRLRRTLLVRAARAVAGSMVPGEATDGLKEQGVSA